MVGRSNRGSGSAGRSEARVGGAPRRSRLWAAVCYFVPLVSVFLGPLGLLLMALSPAAVWWRMRENSFVAGHARRSAAVQVSLLAMMAVVLAVGVSAFESGDVPVLQAVELTAAVAVLLWMLASISGAVRASAGRAEARSVVARMARRSARFVSGG